MPLIRCPKCGQAYDLPGIVAVRLPSSIAPCHCGEWLSGSKAALLARLGDAEGIREIDLSPYRVETAGSGEAPSRREPEPPAGPRSVRIVARGARESLDTIFTIHRHPLWIGRKGCHVELSESELSIRHCSISVEGTSLVVRDADSHMGTFLDGRQIDEAVIEDGVHLLRVGSALVSIEPTGDAGMAVEPVALADDSMMDESMIAERLRNARRVEGAGARVLLVCVDGALVGQEFEVPESGLIVGREGHVRVPDEFLSRKHFEVTRDGEGVVRVRDLGSRNGTFLNTLPASNTKVQAGDEIRAGVNRFRIEHRA